MNAEPDTTIARQVADDLEHRSPIQSKWMRSLADALDAARIGPQGEAPPSALEALAEKWEREAGEVAWRRRNTDGYVIEAAIRNCARELRAGLRGGEAPQ